MQTSSGPTLKSALKRGALVSAANAQVVLIQFLAESLFKLLLAVPIVCGAILVVLLVGGDLVDLVSRDLWDTLTAIAGALNAHPIALATFVIAVMVVLFGGSTLMFLVKGGTVTVLVEGDRAAGLIEQLPVTLGTLRRAAVFSLDRFTGGCTRYFQRYLVLGLTLIGMYAVSGVLYTLVVWSVYRLTGGHVVFLGLALVATSALAALGITAVNLVYLLIQTVVAVDDLGLRAATAQVARFLRAAWRHVAGVLMVILVLVALALAASLLATAALGLIAFVPLFWLAALPLQAVAWLVRGLVFQFLGLTALGAYLDLYRSCSRSNSRHGQPTLLHEPRVT